MDARKILLLTNDSFYAQTLTMVVRLLLNASPELIESPNAAVMLVDQHVPDALIIDLDGGQRESTLNLIARLREDRNTKRLPIIGLSHDEACRDRALGAGVSSFLLKPFKVEDLEVRIVNLIREA